MKNTEREVVTLTERVAARHGFAPTQVVDDDIERWTACWSRDPAVLCEKIYQGEIQYHMWQQGRLNADARRFRAELADSLRARYGATRVRDCAAWRVPDDAESGCAGS